MGPVQSAAIEQSGLGVRGHPKVEVHVFCSRGVCHHACVLSVAFVRYWNEPQHNLKDWQHRYWTASTYARLLRVKNEVDPNGFFVCYHCVGAEQINDAGV